MGGETGALLCVCPDRQPLGCSIEPYHTIPHTVKRSAARRVPFYVLYGVLYHGAHNHSLSPSLSLSIVRRGASPLPSWFCDARGTDQHAPAPATQDTIPCDEIPFSTQRLLRNPSVLCQSTDPSSMPCLSCRRPGARATSDAGMQLLAACYFGLTHAVGPRGAGWTGFKARAGAACAKGHD